MNVKIVKGTTRGEHLCDSCQHIRTRTHEDGHVERQCSVNDERSSWAYIRNSKVVECSVYAQGGNTTLNAMYSTAWMWVKNDDGLITFVDMSSRNNPQVLAAKLSWRRKLRIWWNR